MKIERQDLLKNLIEKFSTTAHNLHSGQCFPFGSHVLRKQQILILLYIFQCKTTVSVKSLAEYLGVTPGAVTQLVDGLVDKKLVERQENTDDRRIVNIKLTPSTGAKFNLFKENFIKSSSQSFSGFSDDELILLTNLLGRIKAVNNHHR